MEDRKEIVTENGYTATVTSGKFGRLYEFFKFSFPESAEKAVRWSRNDASSIEIELRNHQKYIYTYHDEGDWSFQTKKNYLKNLKSMEITLARRAK